MATAISLADLVHRGEHDDHAPSPHDDPSAGALQWLGLAVGQIPFLISSARTVDDLNWSSRVLNSAQMQIALIDALAQRLAGSAALLHHALVAHLRSHPELGDPDVMLGDVDFLSHAMVEDRPALWRRSELMEGGYVTAVADAVQGSGRMSEPADEDALRAATVLVADSIARALATLLGHARLNARDREIVLTRAV